MTLNDVLAWLTSADQGSFLVVSWFVSWALEEVKWWQDLSGKVKSLAVLGLSILLGVAAQFLALQPDLVAAIEPWFQPVLYAVLAWLATQTVHIAGKKFRKASQ